MNQRVDDLENDVEEIKSEIDVIKTQSRMLIQKSRINYINATYIKLGMELLFPRQQSFPFNTDSGLGAFVGIGQHFGESHVAELTLDWDFYPSMTLWYRYEFHLDTPTFTLAPVIGYKLKIAPNLPFDNFASNPEQVVNSFLMIGGLLGIPMNHSLITLQIIYATNSQSVIFVNAGFQFYL